MAFIEHIEGKNVNIYVQASDNSGKVYLSIEGRNTTYMVDMDWDVAVKLISALSGGIEHAKKS